MRSLLGALALTLGLCLTGGGVWMVERHRHADRQQLLERATRAVSQDLLTRLGGLESGLALLAADLAPSEGPQRFGRLAAEIRDRCPEVTWIGWAPRTHPDESAALEAWLRRQDALSLEREFAMRSPSQLARPWYPVQAIAPWSRAPAWIGRDLGDDPRARAAMRRARVDGPLAVSEPLELDGHRQILVATVCRSKERPAWCQCPDHVAHGASFLLAGLDRQALEVRWQEALEAAGLESAAGGSIQTRVVAAPHADVDTEAEDVADADASPTAIRFGDSELAFVLPTPPDLGWSVLSIWVLLGGALASLLCTHLVIGWVDHDTAIGRLVARRTEELAKAKARLQNHAQTVEDEVESRTADLRQMRVELLRQTEELIATNRELETRNQEIESFYHVVSHELRTPLTAIQEFMTILREGLAGAVNDEQQECLGAALESCVQMRRCVDDLFDISRLETGKLLIRPLPGDFLHLLRHTARAAALTAQREGIELTTRLPREIPEMRFDAERIAQVIGNVLGNAVKFTPRGGHVVLETVLHEDVRVVEIVVTDDGPGIPTHQLERIFDRLHQVRSDETQTHGGLGLGLTLCRLIVESHAGRIHAESGEGRGTTIRIQLPIDADLPDRTPSISVRHPGHARSLI